jgi:hypothetical protein
MADLGAIRSRLKTALAVIDGLHALDVMPTQPPSVLPCAIVSPAPGVFLSEVTMDDAEDLQLVVTVLVQKVVDSIAQGAADDFLSGSIRDAIDSSATADWDYAVAQPARGYGQYVWGAGENATSYLGFEIPVTVGVS